jgi:hypothetical protein
MQERETTVIDKQTLSLIEAARRADASEETVRGWCLRLDIGSQIDGRWHVDPERLASVIEARRVLGRSAA